MPGRRPSHGADDRFDANVWVDGDHAVKFRHTPDLAQPHAEFPVKSTQHIHRNRAAAAIENPYPVTRRVGVRLRQNSGRRGRRCNERCHPVFTNDVPESADNIGIAKTAGRERDNGLSIEHRAQRQEIRAADVKVRHGVANDVIQR